MPLEEENAWTVYNGHAVSFCFLFHFTQSIYMICTFYCILCVCVCVCLHWKSCLEWCSRLTVHLQLLLVINFYPLNRASDASVCFTLSLSHSTVTREGEQEEEEDEGTPWDLYPIACNSVNIDWWAKLLLLTTAHNLLLFAFAFLTSSIHYDTRAHLRHN